MIHHRPKTPESLGPRERPDSRADEKNDRASVPAKPESETRDSDKLHYISSPNEFSDASMASTAACAFRTWVRHGHYCVGSLRGQSRLDDVFRKHAHGYTVDMLDLMFSHGFQSSAKLLLLRLNLAHACQDALPHTPLCQMTVMVSLYMTYEKISTSDVVLLRSWLRFETGLFPRRQIVGPLTPLLNRAQPRFLVSAIKHLTNHPHTDPLDGEIPGGLPSWLEI
jgi:hypothetical protein